MSLSNELQHTNHDICLEEAIELTTRFRANIQSMMKPEYAAIGALPICETFKKSIFNILAALPGCVAIRSYLGMDANNQVRLLFVGVDDENNDILADTHDETGYIFEYGQRCPPICKVGPLHPQI